MTNENETIEETIAQELIEELREATSLEDAIQLIEDAKRERDEALALKETVKEESLAELDERLSALKPGTDEFSEVKAAHYEKLRAAAPPPPPANPEVDKLRDEITAELQEAMKAPSTNIKKIRELRRQLGRVMP